MWSIDRHDLTQLVTRKPMAGLDMLTVLAREIHSTQRIVRGRAARNPNEVFEENETVGERIADKVAGFGGSWTFIISFLVGMVDLCRDQRDHQKAVGSVSVHPAEPGSIDAGGDPGAGDHDEPEPAGCEGPGEVGAGLPGEPARGVGDPGAARAKMHALGDKMDDMDDRLRGGAEWLVVSG